MPSPHPLRTILSIILAAALIGCASSKAAQTAPPKAAPAKSPPPPAPATAPAPQSQPAAPKAITHGVPLAPISQIEKRGNGPITMVLIPGLSCDWTVFDSFMDRNAQKYTMYAVTLPGFGGTPPPQMPGEDDFGAWLDNATNAVWKVVQDKKLSKPVIVGHSLGGHVALRLGVEHAKDIRAVISIDGAPAFPFGASPAALTKEQRLTMARQMAGAYRTIDDAQWATTQKGMMASMVTDPVRAGELGELCSKVPAATTIQYLVDLVAADFRDQLPKLTCPTLVTPSAATTDPAVIKTVHELWAELMKDAPSVKYAFFDDTKHFIQDDRPLELDLAISDFLAGREPKGYQAPPPTPSTQPAVTQPEK